MPGRFSSMAICRSSMHWLRSVWNRCEDLLRQRFHDVVERLLLGLGALLAGGLGRLGVDVLLELGMRAQEAEIGDFGRGHQRQDTSGQAAEQGKGRQPPRKASRFQWFRNAVFKYFMSASLLRRCFAFPGS